MPFPVFPMPFLVFPSTKSPFLCAFGARNPYFRPFRAQNRGFCAFLAFGTPVFGLFEHRIGIFVRFCPPKSPFSGISSTKLRFLCAFALRNPRFRVFRAQNWGFCARLRQARHLESAVLPQEAPGRRSFGIGSIGKAPLRLSAPSGSPSLPRRVWRCASFAFCLRCQAAVIVYLCLL